MTPVPGYIHNNGEGLRNTITNFAITRRVRGPYRPPALPATARLLVEHLQARQPTPARLPGSAVDGDAATGQQHDSA